jgi:tripartite-type tricarboxylate transporter receptor subunit TctC
MRAMTLLAGVLGSALMFAAGPGQAQDYPTKPIKVIIPFPPGGGGDNVGRVFAEALSKRLGQPIVIDNKPGADQVIGTIALAHSAPDGYTLMFTGNAMAVHAAYERKLPYDPLRDVLPIAKVANVPVMLLASTQSGIKSVPELIAAARARPESVKAAHIGTGSVHYFCFKMIEHATGVRLLDVPYKGSAPATAALMSGEADLVFTGVGAGLKLAETGRAVVLGVSSSTRSSAAPDVPTLAQAGVPGFELTSDFYLYGPRGLPPAVVDRLSRETTQILADGAMRARLVALGMEVETAGPQKSLEQHQAYFQLHRKLIKAMQLRWAE